MNDIDLTCLPEWVWNLLDALRDYEGNHAPLYRMTAPDEYERAQCIGAYLSDQKAWPPREVQDAAEFRREVLRRATEAGAR